MNKIKVAYIIDTIDFKIGGTERQLILLFQNLDRTKVEPYLCCFKESEWLQEHAQDWNIHTFLFRSFFSPVDYWRLFKFSRFLKREKIDIVQTHFRDGNIIGILAARWAGIKKIISTRRNQGYWHNPLELVLLRILNPMVSNFLANSHAIKEYIHRVEKIPLSKIDVIYNGYDFTRLHSKTVAKDTLRKELDIQPNQDVITIVANLRPVKAIEVFLWSAAEVITVLPNTVFLIVGDGPEKDNLKTLAHKLDIKRNVRFMGSRNDIPDILGISTIGVLCSRSEGLSNAIIEYMASGLPVIATDVGGNSELIEHNKNGILVSPDDYHELAGAIIHLIKNKEQAFRMGQAAKNMVLKKFQINSMLKQTVEYYHKIIKS